MKPAFALSLSAEGITLLHRNAGGWRRVGVVQPDAEDLVGELASLRSRAQLLQDGALRCKLIIPNDHIKYLVVDAYAEDQAERQQIARAALEGATPYAVDDLVFDTARGDGQLHIAAVARETLAEAEAFAMEHDFGPLSFVGVPDDAPYLGEPNFGTSAHAATLLAPGERVDHDGIVVIDIGPAVLPEAPDFDENAAQVADDESLLAQEIALEATEEAEVTQEAPTPEPEPEQPIQTVPAADPVPRDAAPDQPELPEDPAPALPSFSSTRPQADETPSAPAAGPSAETDDTLDGPIQGFVSRRTRASTPPAPLPSPGSEVRAEIRAQLDLTPAQPVAKAPTAPVAAEPKPAPDAAISPTVAPKSPAPNQVVAPVVDRPTPTMRPDVRASETPQPKKPVDVGAKTQVAVDWAKATAPVIGTKAKALSASAMRGAESLGAQIKTKAGSLKAARAARMQAKAARKQEAAPEVRKPKPTQKADERSNRKAQAQARANARQKEAQNLTTFGARQTQTVGGKPRHLGLILTVVLLLALVVIGLISTFTSGGVAGLFGREPDTQIATPAEPTPQPGPTTQIPETAATPDPDGGEQLTAEDAAVLEALRTPEETPEPQPATQTDLKNDQARYAATGIWQRAPEGPAAPTLLGLSDFRAPAIDSATEPLQTAALPERAVDNTDQAVALIASVSTPAATIQQPPPVVVHQGPPPVVPPARPVLTAAAVATPDPVPEPAVAGLRPRVRPAALEEAPETPDSNAAQSATLTFADPTGETGDPALEAVAALLQPDASGAEATDSEPVVQLAALAPADPALAGFRPRLRPGSDVAQPGDTTAEPQDDPAEVQLAALPPANPAHAGVRPRLRPSDIAQPEALAAAPPRPTKRPRLRPAGLVPEPEPEPEAEPEPQIATPEPEAAPTPRSFPGATASAVASSRAPKRRPRSVERRAAQRPKTAPSDGGGNSADPDRGGTQVATIAPKTVKPKSASPQSVAKRATSSNAINLRKINLIGVFGTPSNRRALVRLPSGRLKKVKVGDRIDGGRISAIGESTLRYQKSGRSLTLKIPSG